MLNDTRSRYKQLMASMRRAERSMSPVLESFEDQVLFLKHNLNARAIGALRNELDHWIGCVRGVVAPLVTGEDALAAVEAVALAKVVGVAIGDVGIIVSVVRGPSDPPRQDDGCHHQAGDKNYLSCRP